MVALYSVSPAVQVVPPPQEARVWPVVASVMRMYQGVGPTLALAVAVSVTA